MSDLVGNPEDRFSRVEAHIIIGMPSIDSIIHSKGLVNVLYIYVYVTLFS